MTGELYTVGYASFSMDDFIHILQRYDITTLVDVRSAPYSKFKPEFSKDHLQKTLTENMISYYFLGNLLGARREDSACYTDGNLDYSLLKQSKNFQAGIKSLLDLINRSALMGQNTAIMCAEKDPIRCHRTFLICRTLCSYPVKIQHILEDGSSEEHLMTEKRLLQLYHNPDQPDIFRSERDLLEEIYDRLCENIVL